MVVEYLRDDGKLIYVRALMNLATVVKDVFNLDFFSTTFILFRGRWPGLLKALP